MLSDILELVIFTIALVAPFLSSSACWGLIFFFPTALYMCAPYFSSFRICFFSAFILFSLHAYDLYGTLYSMSSSPWVFKIILLICISLYSACTIGLWLWIGARIPRKPVLYSLSIFTLYLWLYLVWMEYCFLLSFGFCIGYPFFNPLLPLTEYPQLLWLLPHLKTYGLLFLFCITTSSITYAFITQTFKARSVAALLISIWYFGFVITPDQLAPDWLPSIARIPITMHTECITPIIQEQIDQIRHQRPQASIFILPESSCQCAPEWYGNQTLIMGGFIQIENQIHNTLFWVGSQTGSFCKKELVPLTESPFWPFASLYNSLTPSNNERPCIELDFTFTPYICSELFLRHIPDDHYQSLILCTSNDWWFSHAYFKKLMLKIAQMRALEWQRPILYVSYEYGVFIGSSGLINPNSFF